MELKKILRCLKELIDFKFSPKGIKKAYEKQTKTAKYVTESLRIQNYSVDYGKETRLKTLHQSFKQDIHYS